MGMAGVQSKPISAHYVFLNTKLNKLEVWRVVSGSYCYDAGGPGRWTFLDPIACGRFYIGVL